MFGTVAAAPRPTPQVRRLDVAVGGHRPGPARPAPPAGRCPSVRAGPMDWRGPVGHHLGQRLVAGVVEHQRASGAQLTPGPRSSAPAAGGSRPARTSASAASRFPAAVVSRATLSTLTHRSSSAARSATSSPTAVGAGAQGGEPTRAALQALSPTELQGVDDRLTRPTRSKGPLRVVETSPGTSGTSAVRSPTVGRVASRIRSRAADGSLRQVGGEVETVVAAQPLPQLGSGLCGGRVPGEQIVGEGAQGKHVESNSVDLAVPESLRGLEGRGVSPRSASPSRPAITAASRIPASLDPTVSPPSAVPTGTTQAAAGRAPSRRSASPRPGPGPDRPHCHAPRPPGD